MSVKIKVCIYLRCSSDLQDLSIERQRKEVLAYCKAKGYEVIATYIDDGKSGSRDFHKRLDFRRMLADAPKAEWVRIVVYSSSRFGRLDSLKGAPIKLKLRDCGKALETLDQGLIDWGTMEGRIMDTMRSEFDHKTARDIGQLTSSGRDNVLDLGYWPFGEIPYGYDRQYWYEGKIVATLGRQDSVIGVKARDWRLKLIINEDEEKVIKWVFDQFLSGKCRGMRALEEKQQRQQRWSGFVS